MSKHLKVEKVHIDYNGKTVNAKRLTVSSIILMNIEDVWRNVQTPGLLQFVAKGMISFQSVNGEFPEKWQVGKMYKARMKIFGFIPFGGIHYLKIDRIDEHNYEISTKEWDDSAKVWNHDVRLKAVDDTSTYYEDSIVIYGGVMTGFITLFAKRFYAHRQRRWQIVAQKQLMF